MKPDTPSSRPSVPRPVPRKVFDVQRPGRTPATSTSKPVIVSHKPMIQDPSVTMNGVGEPRSLLDSRQKIVVTTPASTPTDTLNVELKPEIPEKREMPAVPVLPTSSPDPQPPLPPIPAPSTPLVAPAHSPQPTLPAPPPPPPASVPLTIPTVPSASAHHAPHPPASTLPEDTLLDDLPAPVIEDKEEVVVSHQVGPRTFPWKTVILVSIVTLLALAVLDILLDADFISWGIPHTHFL